MIKCKYKLNCINFFIHCYECEKYSFFKAYFKNLPNPLDNEIPKSIEEQKEGRRFEKEIAKKVKGLTVPASGAGFWKGDVKTNFDLIQVKTTTKGELRIYIEDILKEYKQATRERREWKRIVRIFDKIYVLSFLDDLSLYDSSQLIDIGNHKSFVIKKISQLHLLLNQIY